MRGREHAGRRSARRSVAVARKAWALSRHDRRAIEADARGLEHLPAFRDGRALPLAFALRDVREAYGVRTIDAPDAG